MSITNLQAYELVSQAIFRGLVVTAPAYNGSGTLTVGPAPKATGGEHYAAYWYKRAQEAREGGAIDRGNVAAWFVDRVGRGEARKAVERAMAKAAAR